MVQIRFDGTGDTLRLCVKGHAGAARRGTDIVCAAVSMLVCTAGAVLQQYARRGELPAPPHIRLAPGDAVLQCRVCPAAADIFDFTMTGFALLANRYPQYIQLKGNDYEGKS